MIGRVAIDPPLQSSIILLLAPLTVGKSLSNEAYQIISVLAQLLWIPAVWLLLTKLLKNHKDAIYIIACCIFSGFFYFNSIFVWPKLIAGSLTVLGIYIILFEPKKSNALLLVMSSSFALGFLAHSSTIFTLIPFGFLLLLKKYRLNFNQLFLCATTILLIISPWLLYQRYIDPPGNRLVKWHIGGSEIIDDRNPLETIISSYSNTSKKTIIENKISNLTTPFGNAPSGYLYSQDWFGKVRDFDFRFMIFGLAFANIGWIIMAFSRPRSKQKIYYSNIKSLLCPTVVSLLLWALVLFGPHITVIHAGSYATMIMLITILYTLISIYPRILKMVTLMSLLYFFIFWYYSPLKLGALNGVFILSILSLIPVMLVLYAYLKNGDRKINVI